MQSEFIPAYVKCPLRSYVVLLRQLVSSGMLLPQLTRRYSLLCSTISFRIGVWNFLLMFALINSVCQ